jgi:hypothetical protein
MSEYKLVRGRWKGALLGVAGIGFGGVFLWLALRDIDPAEARAALRQLNRFWLLAGVALYLGSIGVRCLRWGVLLRAADDVKWRHAAEALLIGFAANYVLPGRVGELFRADYARRIFNMSRFTSVGTIVVERVCDGVVLVGALWLSFAWLVLTQFSPSQTSWILAVGAGASVFFGAALIFIVVASRVDLRRVGAPAAIAARWDHLVKGISSVLRGKATVIGVSSMVVWTLEVLALTSVIRGFGINLTPPQGLMLLGLTSLSTLVPTAPAYAGTYQLVFANVFGMFGYQPTIGIVAATAVQLFCFGTVTILGGAVLLSRSGLTIWRAQRLTRSEQL